MTADLARRDLGDMLGLAALLPPRTRLAAPWLVGLCLICGCDEEARGHRAGSSAGAGVHTGTHQRASAETVSPATRKRWAELVGRQLPATFTDREEERFYARCLEFTRVLHDKAAAVAEQSEHQSRDPSEPPPLLRAVEAVQQDPPKSLPAKDVAWCATYTVKSLKAELGRTVAQQAEATLQAMAGAMAAAHGRTGKLCPSTSAPVPPDLGSVTKGPFQPTPEAWEDPAWRCLKFRWLRPMRFQYELVSTADRFEFIARGSPAADGRIEAYRLAGRLRDGRIELGRATGRFLTEPGSGPAAP